METIQFEAIKTGLRQSKEGYNLTLAVHPDELPDDLTRDFIGSRYMVVMVRIGDDEQPINREHEFPGDNAIKMAGIVCRDPGFWDFIHETHTCESPITSEIDCAIWLCNFLTIESRKELKTDVGARDLFIQLKKGFEKWKRS